MYELKRAADDRGWTALDFPGVKIKVLHTDESSGATTVLTRLAPGATIPRHRHTAADETVYVIEGDFVEDTESFGPGSFFAGRAGTEHGPHAIQAALGSRLAVSHRVEGGLERLCVEPGYELSSRPHCARCEQPNSSRRIVDHAGGLSGAGSDTFASDYLNRAIACEPSLPSRISSWRDSGPDSLAPTPRLHIPQVCRPIK